RSRRNEEASADAVGQSAENCSAPPIRPLPPPPPATHGATERASEGSIRGRIVEISIMTYQQWDQRALNSSRNLVVRVSASMDFASAAKSMKRWRRSRLSWISATVGLG